MMQWESCSSSRIAIAVNLLAALPAAPAPSLHPPLRRPHSLVRGNSASTLKLRADGEASLGATGLSPSNAAANDSGKLRRTCRMRGQCVADAWARRIECGRRRGAAVLRC